MPSSNMFTGLAFLAAGTTLATDLTQHVDVFHGTQNGGNDFPGAARPFGMVKLGPDLLLPGTDAYAGYLSDGEFSGFSLMHEQGTGGAPKYGTLSQLPLTGHVDDPLSNITVPRAKADSGSVGYYQAHTSEGVEVELSASARAGIYRYTFPHGSDELKNVLVDVSHVLPSFRGQGLGQRYEGGNLSVFADGHYEGHGIYNNGWNEAPNWAIFFCGYFEFNATSNKTFVAVGADPSVEQADGFVTSNAETKRIGALFTFNTEEVLSRVGVSWISSEQACRNVNKEIPPGTTFAAVVDEAKAEWSDKVLSKIQTTSTNEKSLSLLYTSLYFMHLIPTNQTGENPGWHSAEPYYQDIFTFWDLFRCSTALMHVLQPAAYEEQIRSLVDIWRHDGYLPDARSSDYNGRTQGGSNADNILADAYVKGVRGAVNWEDAYQAMVKDAEVVPSNIPVDHMAPDSSTHEGRGALPDWLELGYITPKFSRAVSRAVEYAANDFGLSQVAAGLGKETDAAKYLNRSRNWRNHWNPKQSSLGFTGFVVPRNTTGFMETDPLGDSGYWGDPYYEANSWAYSWADVHDMKHLVKLMGGSETVVRRLDTMFTEGAKGSPGTIFDATNEPMFNIPYLYNYVGHPELSVCQSRQVAKHAYSTGPKGLPGNSDAGAMQTWLLWNMMGLYPVTGQTTFLIHSPWFESMTIALGGGKQLTIHATGGDGNGDENIYVQGVTVNGKAWTKSWLTWEDVFAEGGVVGVSAGGPADPVGNW
ncbi:Alpha-1,2-mannosidase [Penicillium ucsense]|uniref:Alpha-1,2-mannosidase n=1 Tax=Penicillium ucsense TaxID=2839758 RepID=A0A8J8WIC3_9EURO|nr:Alpha-1,2-mannosidase [Penicillium ucsense]KAF7736360.1 Alpha-1,2-mannosidase [Penicillium ucsense]